MKKIIYLLAAIVISTIYGCKSGLLVGETKVPFEKVCGSQGKYKCRANGVAAAKLDPYIIYLKERPDVAGKTRLSSGNNYYNLGRTVDNVAFNNPGPIIIELKESEVEVDTALIDYDLKKDNITDIIAELDATLKKEKVSLDASVKIKNDFNRELNNYLKIKGTIITFTVNSDITDGIDKAKAGISVDERYVNAYKLLAKNGNPFVRQVKVVEEVCKFSENKNLSNILQAVIKANLGENDLRANSIVDATLSKKLTSTFTSSFNITTIYSYGYWHQPLMIN
jgi:hypothetical protein